MLRSRASQMLILILTLCFAYATPAFAQSAERYPARPIHFIVPFPAGGGGDVLARILSVKLGEALGQPVVVENVPGAGGNIGAAKAARSAADGYTMLFAYIGTHSVNPSLYSNLPFKEADFAPLIWLASIPQLMTVHPSVPARSVKEFIDLAKSKPGALNYASTNPITQLAAELFNTMAGVNVVHIPYKGGAPATAALLSGEVQLAFLDPTGVLPNAATGRLRVLAVTAGKRIPSLPDVPTVSEAGLSGYQLEAWSGILVPAGTPTPIVQRLNAEINKILAMPEIRDRMRVMGYEQVGGTPEEFSTLIRTETAKWAPVIRAAKMKVD